MDFTDNLSNTIKNAQENALSFGLSTVNLDCLFFALFDEEFSSCKSVLNDYIDSSALEEYKKAKYQPSEKIQFRFY